MNDETFLDKKQELLGLYQALAFLFNEFDRCRENLLTPPEEYDLVHEGIGIVRENIHRLERELGLS